MAWDLSADREREQMESLRNAWLEREEVILNHFRVSAAMFRWGYRILGIIAALVAAIMLAVGLIERNRVFDTSLLILQRLIPMVEPFRLLFLSNFLNLIVLVCASCVIIKRKERRFLSCISLLQAVKIIKMYIFINRFGKRMENHLPVSIKNSENLTISSLSLTETKI